MPIRSARGTRIGGLAAVMLAGIAAAPAAGPTVTAVDAPGLKRAVAARKGKVVVVNFWATWCAPCVKEFPDLVRLHNKHRARGLELVTVSVDSARDIQPKAAPFLAKQKAPAGAYTWKGDQDAFIGGFDPKWQGEVPRTYIYDRSGKRVKTLTGEHSLAQFEAAVAPYLARR